MALEDDAALLERIRRDEPGAFDAFVAAYGDRIYGFGRRVCGESEDARDVMQDTLLQAYLSIKDLEHPEALRSWLYRVASNACLMKRRKGKYEPARELSLEELAPRPGEGPGVEIPDPGSLPDEDLERTWIQERVRAAIGDLPDHYRIVLVMRDMEHLSTEETADALSLPVTTVKMRLHRARLMVRQRLEAALSSTRAAGGKT
jgi:RNA polymerase sigma-70 factor, ECF subfamily